MKPILLIILSIFVSKKIAAQGESLFEKYIASLEATDQPLSYNNFVKYDTLNKENNIANWITFCMKNLQTPEESNEKEFEATFFIHIDSNGFVNNVTSNTKTKILLPFLKKKLINRNFYSEFISKVKINGYCISKVDEDFYTNYFKGNVEIPINFNGSNDNCCK